VKDSAADGKTKSCAWSDCRSGPEFHANCGSGRVGLGHFTCWSGWIRVRKIGPTSNSVV